MKKAILVTACTVSAIISCIGIVTLLPVGGASARAPESPPEDFDARARKVVAQMTLDEKFTQLHGLTNRTNHRVVPGLPRLGIPALTVTNGPAGAGPAGPGHEGKATALPAPISLAATWDVEAARDHGEIAAEEAGLLGNLLLESPDINIARTPHNGRTFESFGEDPVLAGALAVANIKGIQGRGLIANVKHFAGNNQENNRFKIDDDIDERTLRELYLPAFEASVKEGRVDSVMAAYNKINGAHCCENDFLLNKVLKGEWKFDGFVTSDFWAVHSTVPSAKNGLDLEMPNDAFFGDALKKAVQSGDVPESLLDEKLVRRFRTMMRRGVWDKQPARGAIPPEHAAVAMKIGAEGAVLLKNAGGQLPLQVDAIHSIALIGPFAGQAKTGGGGSSWVNPIHTVSPADGIRNVVGKDVAIHEDDGKDVARAAAVAKEADIAILMLGDHQAEGDDHPIALAGNQDALAAAVLAANPHTVVVLKTGGPVLMPWVDQAPAILEAWYPGGEDGDAVAAVLFGNVNPSGKLPITFPKRDEDLPLHSPEQYPGVNNVAHYSEGLLVGYRWYDTKDIEPLFPFGHGLSYTTFAYKDLKVSPPTDAMNVSVEFTVTNTGKRAGVEVAQVYVSLPSLPKVPQPPRQLKAFRRIELAPEESAQVALTLDTRSLSYWDVESHGWKVAPGVYTVSAGASSRDLRIKGTFEVTGAAVLAALLTSAPAFAAEPARLSVLMLGDDGHHRPADLAKLITPILAKDGIDVAYTEDVDAALTPDRLAKCDALLIFRDHGDLPPKAEAALMNFVEGGKGLFALHCASNCFRNSDKYTALVGGRFLKHETGTFRAKIIDAQHPAMRGLSSFESWDETYVHDQLGKDIRVLMVREEQGGYEPYTWVREQGKGRVFYTALGHDEHTWKAEGFQKLLEQGLRWSAGIVEENKDVKPFEYVDAHIPFYIPEKGGATSDQPTRNMQLPLDPPESMKHMHLPEGFEVQLFASDPDIYRPICMAWDARGRLWIAETLDYPNDMQPPGKGHDRIVILEDTKGTGKADKFTVFAEGLSIPTSMTFARGGVIVTQAPNTLFLKDTDGDDKADVRETLFSGWGTRDTHAGPSNLRYGFDNWVWGTVGYSGFDGKIGGKLHRFSQGIWRMKSDGTDLEFLTSTSNNTWGLGLSETGEVFASTANNQHSVFLGVPNRYFEEVRGWHGTGSMGIEDHKKFHPVTDKIRQVDWHGGYTAACGHALYTARSFPEEFWNRAAFVCEPTGHLVHVDWLTPQGSGFVAKDGWNILASDDEWTAPVCAEVGPDGALWVIDWYNYIVQHNPTPKGFDTGKGAAYVTPLRDKTHGRIYRIVYKGAKPSPTVDFTKADEKELIATLSHENLWQRTTAQRLLVERGNTDVLPQLAAVVKDGKSAVGAFHALWTMHGLGAFASAKSEAFDAVKAALASADPGVRRAALAVMPRTAEGAAVILTAKSVADADATVRLEALLALSEMPASKESAAAVLAVVLDPKNAADPWIPSAAIVAAAHNDMEFLLAATATAPPKDAPPTFTQTIRVVAEHLARQAPDGAAPKLLAALKSAEPATVEPVLAGLSAGWSPARKPILDDAAQSDFAALAARLPQAGLLQLAKLAKRWGQEKKMAGVTGKLHDEALKRVADDKLPDDARLAAAHDLLSLDDDESIPVLLDQIGPQSGPALTVGMLDVLADSTSEAVGPAVAKRWSQLTPAGRGAAVDLLLKRSAWAEALLDAVDKGGVDKGDLSVEQAQRLSKYPDPAVAERAKKLLATGGGLPNPDRQKVVDAFAPALKRHGDAARGRKVFEDNCAKCHRHGEIGANIGPDLTGMAVHERADLAIDILDPNRSVEGNYRQYTVLTKDGRVLTGLLLSETQTTVELMDSQAKKHDVLREDIDEFKATKLSLMPEGFEKLGEDDLLAVLEFLTVRDKFFPLPLGKAATIASVKGMFISKDADEQRLIFPKWGPQTSFGVPFQVIDPRDGAVPNVIELYGPDGAVSKGMPKSAIVPCNAPARAIHILGGVGGWCWPYGKKGTTSMIVRLHYADGKTEDHALLNGVQMADYIREVDVPESQLAFKLRGQQIRYLSIKPERSDKIDTIEFVKGDDDTAPVVMAVTVESLP